MISQREIQSYFGPLNGKVENKIDHGVTLKNGLAIRKSDIAFKNKLAAPENFEWKIVPMINRFNFLRKKKSLNLRGPLLADSRRSEATTSFEKQKGINKNSTFYLGHLGILLYV